MYQDALFAPTSTNSAVRFISRLRLSNYKDLGVIIGSFLTPLGLPVGIGVTLGTVAARFANSMSNTGPFVNTNSTNRPGLW
jgi:hypothetical protein